MSEYAKKRLGLILEKCRGMIKDIKEEEDNEFNRGMEIGALMIFDEIDNFKRVYVDRG